MRAANLISAVSLKPFGRIHRTIRTKRKRSLFLAFMFFYFAFHLITGERGLLAYVQLKGQLLEAKSKSAAIHEAKLDLANKVTGLRSESLNLDLLEEVARRDLGYSRKDEMVYFPD